MLVSYLLTSEQIPQAVSAWVTAKEFSPWMFLVAVNVALLAAGQFMEPSSIVLILAPLFLPIAQSLGIDPIHFGLIMVLNLMIGLLTPPVGMVLFVLAKVSRLGFEKTVTAVLPWMIPLFATLIIITFVPEVVLWLPKLLYP
jgi:C4-dicarboxylate transporter DctM subunit